MKTVTRRSDRKLYNAEFDGDQWWVEGNGTRGYYTPEDFETFFEPADAPTELDALRREVKVLNGMVDFLVGNHARKKGCEYSGLKCRKGKKNMQICTVGESFRCVKDYARYFVKAHPAYLKDPRAQAEAEIAKEGKE